MFSSVFWSRIAALVLLLAQSSAWSAEVRFKSNDLPDIVANQDLWELQYTVTGEFVQFDGLNLFYATDKFADLSLAPPPDTAAFASSLVQPESGLGADGILTLTAERVLAGETHQFSVTFVWLSNGAPGAQPFEVFDGTSFEVTQFGVTQAVPEPESAALILFGLAVLAALRRKQSVLGVRS